MPTFETLWKTELTLRLNNSDTSALFTSTVRQDAIREAEEEFADLTECLIRQSTITCSCNTAEYNLNSSAVLGGSTDFVRLAKQGVEYHHQSSHGGSSVRLRTVSGDDFPRRDIEWLNRFQPNWRESTSPVELPTGYYLRADGGTQVLGLVDKPDIGSSEVGKLVIPYVAKPQAMTSSSAEPFTVAGSVRADLRIYHKALPHYGAYKLLPLVGDMEGANQHLQVFLGYVTRYTQAQRPKGGQHVAVARSYFREARRMGGGGDLSIARDPRWGQR
jgi:hypothetical protein